MASSANSRPRLWSLRMVLTVWAPIVAIGALHYATEAQHMWVHDVLRRVYYLPILFAAFQAGLRGGLVAAVVVSLSYLPHAFMALGHMGHMGHMMHADPADSLEKILEVVLYNVVALVAGYLTDSERRRARELSAALDEQRNLHRQLVRAGRLGALGEVVAGIAHEIKNPLHALQGTAEIIDPLVPAGSEERRLWEIHVSELSRLERVADRFLSFARPAPLELVELDLGDVVRRLSELVGADARRKQIEIETRLADAPVPVRGDRDQLAQIALNIVVNAFRAIGDGPGHVRISIERDVLLEGRRMHAVRIENDGPAIPDADIEHLFDPFHGDADGGTGLGLSISERIAEQHGGTILAENGGLGVAFSLYLPTLDAG